jgi:hypothetical protein
MTVEGAGSMCQTGLCAPSFFRDLGPAESRAEGAGQVAHICRMVAHAVALIEVDFSSKIDPG